MAEASVSTGTPGTPARRSRDQVPTSGFAVHLSEATLRELMADIGAVIDAVGGSIPVHYTTVVETSARAGAG